METKKILFGLIEINATLYNILYTLLCIVILFTVLCGLACLCVEIDKNLNNEYVNPLLTMTNSLVLYFLGCKLFAKNNYA